MAFFASATLAVKRIAKRIVGPTSSIFEDSPVLWSVFAVSILILVIIIVLKA